MKKLYTILCFAVIGSSAWATQHTVTISGFSYVPSFLTAAVGDTLNMPASNTHPNVQVSMATWNANGSTPLAGGWGMHTSAFQYVIPALGDIFYVCANHVGSGMKGQIQVLAGGVADLTGVNRVKILRNFINDGQVTVMNTTGIKGTMLIYDLNGKQVDDIQLSSDEQQIIELKMQHGTYLYRFNMEGRITETEKLYITAR
jgi:plastocyanin